METTHANARPAKVIAGASIANSLLLPVVAAVHFNIAFWTLVVSNFMLFHAIWVTQLVRLRRWEKVDWGWTIYRWPLALIAFALLGTVSYAIWETQLDSVFPS